MIEVLLDSGLPDEIDNGTAATLTEHRAITLDAAFAAHPIRFKGVAPLPPALPPAAWINPPKNETVAGRNQTRLLTRLTTNGAQK
jgi:hypothetical protein